MNNNQSVSIITIFTDRELRKLAILLLISLAGYILLAVWFPIIPNADQIPLMDIRSFSPSLWQGLVYGLIITILFAAFILIARRISSQHLQLELPTIIIISIIFSLPLLFVYPINANDIYRYVIRGRISSIYQDNPFTASPSDFPNDPFLPLAGEWAGETSPYGPLWESLAGGLTLITGDNLIAGLLLFKLLALLAFVAVTFLIWKLLNINFQNNFADSLSDLAIKPGELIIFWAWNPALLLIFIINGHNDITMIFFLLAGYLLIVRNLSLPGFFLMLLGALAKPIGALALPVFFIVLLLKEETWVKKLRFCLVAAVGSIVLVLLSFSLFGSHMDLIQRLLREAGSGGSFSPAVLGLLLLQVFGVSLTRQVISSWTTIWLALFAGFVLWLLWRTWRGRSPLRGTADIFIAYIVQALNFRIWYATWPYPWLLLDRADSSNSRTAQFRFYFGFWFLFTSQLSVLIYGHLRIYIFNGSQVAAHIMGVIFTFLLPLLGAWLSVKFRLLEGTDRGKLKFQ